MGHRSVTLGAKVEVYKRRAMIRARRRNEDTYCSCTRPQLSHRCCIFGGPRGFRDRPCSHCWRRAQLSMLFFRQMAATWCLTRWRLNGSVVARLIDREMQCYCWVSDSGFVRRVDEAAKRDMCGLRCATCTAPHRSVPIELRCVAINCAVKRRKEAWLGERTACVFSEAWRS